MSHNYATLLSHLSAASAARASSSAFTAPLPPKSSPPSSSSSASPPRAAAAAAAPIPIPTRGLPPLPLPPLLTLSLTRSTSSRASSKWATTTSAPPPPPPPGLKSDARSAWDALTYQFVAWSRSGPCTRASEEGRKKKWGWGAFSGQGGCVVCLRRRRAWSVCFSGQGGECFV